MVWLRLFFPSTTADLTSRGAVAVQRCMVVSLLLQQGLMRISRAAAGSLKLRDAPSSRQVTLVVSEMGDDRSVVDCVPIDLRRELLDVSPIPLCHNRVPVVEIDYTDETREVLSYLRAFVAKGEKSERALALTGQVRDVPPGPLLHVWKVAKPHLRV